MSTKTDVLPEIEEEISEPDGKAHYVRVSALILGGAVTALCGKKYVPVTIAEAGEREICAKCAELMELLKAWE